MYRFNGGRGTVTCDVCNIIFAENLSHAEYLEYFRYNKEEKDKDLCKDHRSKRQQEEYKQAKAKRLAERARQEKEMQDRGILGNRDLSTRIIL